MAHYAKVTNSIVQQVIVAEAEFVENLVDNIAGRWVQTSYNTYGGQHRLGGTPLRKNFAGVGMTYDANRDAFIPQKPDGNYRLNEDTCLWELVE
jgi:hypothetical protein